MGIDYATPEEFFLNEDPQPFKRTLDHLPYLEALSISGKKPSGAYMPVFTKANERDIVLFCGSPGAGKSTFYWTILEPLGYERVNQDTLKTVCGPHDSPD